VTPICWTHIVYAGMPDKPDHMDYHDTLKSRRIGMSSLSAIKEMLGNDHMFVSYPT
jgi:hypothetical protein